MCNNMSLLPQTTSWRSLLSRPVHNMKNMNYKGHFRILLLVQAARLIRKDTIVQGRSFCCLECNKEFTYTILHRFLCYCIVKALYKYIKQTFKLQKECQ